MQTIEILTNTECPRRCPNCNQRPWMMGASGYEYKPEDAEELCSTLVRYDKKYDVVLSGGEPLILTTLPDIVRILRSSPAIDTISITSSHIDIQMIDTIIDDVDNIYFSCRGQKTDKLNRYGNKVHHWDTTVHVDWPTEPYMGDGYCCCTHVGVFCCVIGQEVYPCTLAMSLKYLGRWEGLEGYSLDDYFGGTKTFSPIGTYEACRYCVNNQGWRDYALNQKLYRRTLR